MHKQQGAALIVVLALLTGATVIGISSMQSSVVDERLAGNYRMASQAHMNAEKAASRALENLETYFPQAVWDAEPNTGWFKGLDADDQKDWEGELREMSHADLFAMANMDDSGNESGEFCDEYDAVQTCFYFTLLIPDGIANLPSDGKNEPGKYIVAVGAVEDNSGKPMSSSVVLVKIEGSQSDDRHEGIDPDIATLFDAYLMASRKNSFVKGKDEGNSEDPSVTIDGSMHIEDAEQDFKTHGNEVTQGENYVQTRGDTVLGTPIPEFDLDAFEEAARKNAEGNARPVTTKSGDHACQNLPQDLGGKVYVCKGQQDLSNINYTNGTLIFKDQVDLSGETRLKDVNIVVTGNSGAITFLDDLFLDNVKIGAKDEIEYNWDGEGTPGRAVVKNSHFMANSMIQLDFDNDFEVDGAYFYTNKEAEIEFGNSPDAKPCGSIIGREQAELYVDDIDTFRQCAPGSGSDDGWRLGAWR